MNQASAFESFGHISKEDFNNIETRGRLSCVVVRSSDGFLVGKGARVEGCSAQDDRLRYAVRMSLFPPIVLCGRRRRVSSRWLFVTIFVLHTLGRAVAGDVANVFFEEKLKEIDATISLAISDGHCPGGVLWLERNGAAYHKAFGNRAIEPAREPMTEDTLFDAASLTKVVATTPAIMLARGDQILAVPTLVKKLPSPVRKILGDLSNTERVLVGLDLQPGQRK